MKSVFFAGVAACALTAVAAAQESVVVDVSGIQSFAGLGSPANTVLTVELLSNAEVVGLAWDVVIQANGGSWLSETRINFGSTSQGFLNLAPGTGVNDPGDNLPTPFSGSANLVDLELDFAVGEDGILRMEFFESFVDGLNPDAVWVSGTVTVQYVPAPGAVALLGLAGLAGSRRRRG